ncbi:uncharacterized protein LOC110880772 [Helianthus annuus]|uniref:uncharacterized protein LOC110880772 n=1 Tax=Helianthus annuus TaxID=4232 RepID=UPI000B8F8EEF|nr:uncharacterized protein LOC110880772 [Helianthus annuus]
MFSTKEEVKKFIRKYTVESRRQFRIVKDEADRVRVACLGGLGTEEVKHGVKEGAKTVAGEKKLAAEKKLAGEKKKSKGPQLKNDKSPGKKSKGPEFENSKVERTIEQKHKGGRGHKKNPSQNTCPWVALISLDKETKTWLVKTFNHHHKCLQSRVIKACTSTYLAEELVEQIEQNPNIPVKAVQEQFQRKYQLEISKMQAYRARSKAQNVLHGDFTAHLKAGFKAIGRDLLGVDGAFMKGPFPGQVLTTVGVDNNNGIYPVAYAIVEAENNNSWLWFLQLLGQDLDIGPMSNFVFMSDRQKGILEAVSRLFPCAEHRFCVRHIHENMQLTFKGRAYKDILWKLARSTTVVYFEKTMEELKRINTKAHLWLSKIDPKHWSRSHFTGRGKSDVLLNNMCEVFNSKILDGRDKPIITILEYIREYCMRRIVNVLQVIDKTDRPLTPFATELFEEIKKSASGCRVSWNGGDQYGVAGPGKWKCVVDMGQKTCTCRTWEITGIPCSHVVATIWNMQSYGQKVGIPESWVHPIYHLDTWKQVYNFKVFPINGISLWNKSRVPTTIIEPKYHKPVGRPKKKRKRSLVEKEDVQKACKLSKKNLQGSCGKCKGKGHNSRTCTGVPPDQQNKGVKTKTMKKGCEGKNVQKKQGRGKKKA